MSVRIGYGCINLSLGKKVCPNKTCRLATISSIPTSQERYDFLVQKALSNFNSVLEIVKWHAQEGHRFYRMSSDMVPHISNPSLTNLLNENHLSNYQNLRFAESILKEIGDLAKRHDIRLTMHPGQFDQLGSPHENVIINTFNDLIWHAKLLDLMNLDLNSVLCIHGGGCYGNKKEALIRWKANFLKLPKFVQQRIALENCEKGYSVEDLLPICEELKIPLILDFFHWLCYFHFHPGETQELIINLLPRVLNTWGPRIPKFHLSEQAPNKQVGSHSDFVEIIPDELLWLAQQNIKFDIMIEAKQKDLAMIHLIKKYPQFDPHYLLYQRFSLLNHIKTMLPLTKVDNNWLIQIIDNWDQEFIILVGWDGQKVLPPL